MKLTLRNLLSELLTESDAVTWDGEQFSYNQENGVSIAFFCPNNLWVAAKWRMGTSKPYISSNSKLQNMMNNYRGAGVPDNHPDFTAILYDVGEDNIVKSIKLKSRLFQTKRSDYPYILGFWEDKKTIKSYKNSIFNYLAKLGIDPKKILWAHSGGSSKGKKNTPSEPYNVFFGGNEGESLTPEQKALMQIQHLDAIAKRKLLKLPPNRFERLADSIGITVAELRQKLGSSDENQTL